MSSLQVNASTFTLSTGLGGQGFTGNVYFTSNTNVDNVYVTIVYNLSLTGGDIFTTYGYNLFGKVLSSNATELSYAVTPISATNNGPGGGVGTGSLLLSPSGLNNTGNRSYIGQPLYILFYSSQQLNVISGGGFTYSLPYQFLFPGGGSLNTYGGIQNILSYTIQPCSAPTSLSATSYQNGYVPLTWTAPNSDGGSPINSYVIRYSSSSSSGPWSSLYYISVTTSFSFGGLTNGTTYWFQVAAVNGFCGSGAPDSGPFITSNSATPATTPDQVTGVTTTSGPNVGNISVSWTTPGNGGLAISSYILQYRISGTGSWTTITGISSVATNYVITGLANSTTYDIRVAAVNIVGTGAYSNIVTETTFTTPNQVTGVTTTSGPNVGNISVTWTAPGNGGLAISSYTLQYRISGPGSFTTITGIGTTNTIVTGLANSTTYDIRVAAVNIAGTGAYSNIVIGLTFTTPNSPTNLTGTAGNAQVSLTWTAPTNNGGTPITGYLVEYNSTDPSGPWTPVNTGSTATTYTLTGLTNGTLYYVRVSGVNIVGTGTPSNVISLTPSTIPGPAIIISSASCDNQQVLVTWAPPTNTGGAPILSYNLQYSNTGLAGSWLPTPTPYSVAAPTTSYTFTGLTNGTLYYFQVAAVNTIGVGPYSAQTPNSNATPSITPQPPIPITTTAITSSSIAVSWTTPTGLANTGGNPITGYIVYWSQISSTGSVIPPVYSYNTTTSGTPLATTYTITHLTHATLYEIQISSINCSGVGPLSSLPNSLYSLYSLYITTASIPPSAPTNVVITGCNTGYTNSVRLTWTAPANDGGSPIINYVIYYRTTPPPNSTWYTHNTNSASTTAIVTLPLSSTSYDFKVAAQNIADVSIFSSPIVSSSSYNPPTAPANLVATTDANGFVILTWTASTQDLPQTISYYVIEYKLCEFGGWITYPTTIPSPTTSATINNLNIANNLTYLYRVYAVNSCGARSPLSNTASATSYNNNAPTRLWSRFDINCSGDITSVDSLTRNMLRKGQILQYPAVGSLQYSRATLWSMAAKNQLSRQKAWASQSQEYTYPNITNINNEPGVGLRQTATSLVCWTPPPAVICNTSGASGVPGNSTTLCISKNAPFNNYRHPNTYSSGGTKFPVFFSK
jgi:titin